MSKSTLSIVCIGSSAGGLAPILEFFKNMDPHCDMAFVVIQHLQADRQSLTPYILSRITRMEVSAAMDKDRAKANHVYTIEANTQLAIADDQFIVQPRTESPGRHKPFDRFLNSLAINSRERAIAVIFSGYDGDGSAGFVAIKAQGGSTYAQDRGAQVDEMPEHAIATGCVDYVLDPKEIAVRISGKC